MEALSAGDTSFGLTRNHGMRSRRNISKASDLSPSPAGVITPADCASTGPLFAGIAMALTRVRRSVRRKASGLSPLAADLCICARFALTGARFAGALTIGSDKHRRRRTSDSPPLAAAVNTPARSALTGARFAGDATAMAKRRRRKASGSNRSAAALNTPARSAATGARFAGGKPSENQSGGRRRESFSRLERGLSGGGVVQLSPVGSRFRGNDGALGGSGAIAPTGFPPTRE